jgi:hypothetical protein
MVVVAAVGLAAARVPSGREHLVADPVAAAVSVVVVVVVLEVLVVAASPKLAQMAANLFIRTSTAR